MEDCARSPSQGVDTGSPTTGDKKCLGRWGVETGDQEVCMGQSDILNLSEN